MKTAPGICERYREHSGRATAHTREHTAADDAGASPFTDARRKRKPQPFRKDCPARAESLRRKDMKKYSLIVIGILAALLAFGAVSCDQQGQQAQTEPGTQGEMEPGAQAQGEQPMEGQPGQQAMPSTPINVNTASVEELSTIPGLDQTLAQNIIDYREANGPFASVDDLSRVSGMDQQTLDSIRGWITVEEGGAMPEQAPEQLPEQMPGQTPEQSPGGMGGDSGV